MQATWDARYTMDTSKNRQEESEKWLKIEKADIVQYYRYGSDIYERHVCLERQKEDHIKWEQEVPLVRWSPGFVDHKIRVVLTV